MVVDRVQLLGLGVFLAGAVLLMLSLGVCIQEDAFISFRYAANLVEGYGLVYNPGERVEGYSNFLWTLLMAGGMTLGADPVALARFAGMTAALAVIVVVFVAARRETGHGGASGGLLAAAVLAASPPVASEGVQGLETALFALLVTVGTLLSVEAHRDALVGPGASGKAASSGAVLAVAAMTRPEGLGVLGLTLMGSLAWGFARGRRAPSREDLVTAAVFFAAYTPYWIWRLAYYGYPFPNTFYAKTGGGLAHVWKGLAYEADFARNSPVLVALTVALLAAGLWKLALKRDERARDPFGFVAGAVIVGYLGYVVLVGGDFKRTFRFIVPVLPLWAVWLDRAVCAHLASRPPRIRGGVVVGLLIAIVANGALQVPRARRWAVDRRWDLERRTAAGLWLANESSPGDTLAIHSAGVIPYYSGLHTIDMWGINDLHIGHRKMPDMGSGIVGHEKGDPAYVFGRRPTYYVDQFGYVSPKPLKGLKQLVLMKYPLREIRRFYRERTVEVWIPAGESKIREWFTFLERSDSTQRPGGG